MKTKQNKNKSVIHTCLVICAYALGLYLCVSFVSGHYDWPLQIKSNLSFRASVHVSDRDKKRDTELRFLQVRTVYVYSTSAYPSTILYDKETEQFYLDGHKRMCKFTPSDSDLALLAEKLDNIKQ